MSAEQQAEVKRRSSRAAREGGRRRRRSRTTAPPTVQEATQADIAAEQPAPEPRSEASRAEARRKAKAESAKSQGRGRGLISNERTEGLRKFIRETRAEIDKVVWPDRETTRNLTLLVIALSVVLGIVLGGIDFVLYQIFEAL